jgi:putative Mg2+ transporter-C (MgtC) family protein
MTYDFIGQHEIDFLIDLGLCLISGIIIGAERESRRKDAGISTHVLVIIGAMVFTFLSSVSDPASKSRIAAQVVTGIGFLGAGLILKEGTTVKNLTTAASLWAAASIGMAYGFNYHLIGLVVTMVLVLVPRIPHVTRRSPAPKRGEGEIE